MYLRQHYDNLGYIWKNDAFQHCASAIKKYIYWPKMWKYKDPICYTTGLILMKPGVMTTCLFDYLSIILLVCWCIGFHMLFISNIIPPYLIFTTHDNGFDLYMRSSLDEWILMIDLEEMTFSFHLSFSCIISREHVLQQNVFSSVLHPPTPSLVRTLLYDSSTVWVLSDLQQDLLHVSVFPRGVDQLCDLLLQGPRQRHQLDKLAFWAFVNLQAHEHKTI